MKKIIIIMSIIGMILVINNKKDELIIPNEAIRFRIIANSNSKIDQENKLKVRNALEEEMFNDIENVKTKSEAKSVIKDNIKNYQNIIETTLDNKINYDINYGLNYFPEKEYKGVKYNEGYYESLVISLGDAKGDNWWCVLFPPLCLLEAEDNNTEEVEYRSFIKDIIDRYF